MAQEDAAVGVAGSMPEGLGEVSSAIAALASAVSSLPEGEDFHFYRNFAPLRARMDALREGAGAALGSLRAAEWAQDTADAHDSFVDLLDDALEGVDAALDEARKASQGPDPSSSPLLHSAHSQGGKGRAIERGEPFGRQGLVSDTTERRTGQHRELPRFGSTFQPNATKRAGWRPQDDFLPPPDTLRPSSLCPPSPLPSSAKGSLSAEIPSGQGLGSGSARDRVAAHALRLGVASGGTEGPGGGGSSRQAAKEALLRVPQKWQAFQMEVEAEQVRRDRESVSTSARRTQRLQDTPFSFVDSVEGLEAAAKALEGVQEVAVDLENHSFRSYEGFLCLMQLSTRDHDFVIDTLVPPVRQHLPRLLGPIFESSTIVKVMHGANMDIVWLQRDFGMLVANLFDTGQAARVLGLPSFGLAHLLKDICGVTANKSLQMADWRVRPLPTDMLKYAREDTHFLLHTYDVLRQRLLQAPASPGASLLRATSGSSPPVRPAPEGSHEGATASESGALTPSPGESPSADTSPTSGAASPVSSPGCAGSHPELTPGAYPPGARKIVEGPLLLPVPRHAQVLERSLSICLLEHHPPVFNPSGYLKIYSASRRHYTEPQLSALAALYEWRDRLSRSLDESTGYVLPNHMLLKLAKELPASASQLRALVRGSAPLVLQNSSQVLAIIQGAQDAQAAQGAEGAQSHLLGPSQGVGLASDSDPSEAHPQGATGHEAEQARPEELAQGQPDGCSVSGEAGRGPMLEAASGETAEAQGAGAEIESLEGREGAPSLVRPMARAESSGADAASGEKEGIAASQAALGQGVSGVPAGEGVSGVPAGEGVRGVPASEAGNGKAATQGVQGNGIAPQPLVPAVVVCRRGSSRGALGSMLGAKKKAPVTLPPATTAMRPSLAASPVQPPPSTGVPPADAEPSSTPPAQAPTSSTTLAPAIGQRRAASTGVLGALLGSKRKAGQAGAPGAGTAAAAASGALHVARGAVSGSTSDTHTGSLPAAADTGNGALGPSQPVDPPAAAEEAATSGVAGGLGGGRMGGSGVPGQHKRDLQAEVLARVRLSVAGVHPSDTARVVLATSTWERPRGEDTAGAPGGGAGAGGDKELANGFSCSEDVHLTQRGGEGEDGAGGRLGQAGVAVASGVEETFIGFNTGGSNGQVGSESEEGCAPASDEEGSGTSDKEGSGASGEEAQARKDTEQEPGSDSHGASPADDQGVKQHPGQAQQPQPGKVEAEVPKSKQGKGAPCAGPTKGAPAGCEAPFDFEAARQKFNLWGSAPKKEVPVQRKGAKKRPLPPVQQEFFDPIAPLRQDSHAGPKGGKRPQVFPRSGNRSHTFRD